MIINNRGTIAVIDTGSDTLEQLFGKGFAGNGGQVRGYISTLPIK